MENLFLSRLARLCIDVNLLLLPRVNKQQRAKLAGELETLEFSNTRRLL